MVCTWPRRSEIPSKFTRKSWGSTEVSDILLFDKKKDNYSVIKTAFIHKCILLCLLLSWFGLIYCRSRKKTKNLPLTLPIESQNSSFKFELLLTETCASVFFLIWSSGRTEIERRQVVRISKKNFTRFCSFIILDGQASLGDLLRVSLVRLNQHLSASYDAIAQLTKPQSRI